VDTGAVTAELRINPPGSRKRISAECKRKLRYTLHLGFIDAPSSGHMAL